MLNRLTICSVLTCCVLIQPAFATTVYVYQDKKGTRVISDRPSRDNGLELIKTYTPRSSVEVLGPRHYNYPQRKLDTRKTEYDKIIYAIADNYRQDRALIKAIIQIESSFNPNALSPKGAQGLMQLMPATASHYKVQNPFNARENLRGGIEFFSDLMTRYENDIRLALAAYNAGPGAVSRHQGIPPYPETQAYVAQVLRLHKNYQLHSDTYS